MDQFLPGSENLCGNVCAWYLQLRSGGNGRISKNPQSADGYRFEKCRVKPEDEVIGGYNALFIAARSGSYDVVVYLVSEKRMVVTPKMRKHAKDDRVKDYLSRW